jgi:GDP/UDP-N,N'-diacetylbacillosamine 2-epimerase (hydrolysing)
MSIRKKILAFSGIRSDYDLLSGVYKEINKDSAIDFRLVVSGAHLSPSYGYTLKYIEKDNLPILCKIESLLDSNSPMARIKSAAILLQSCIHSVSEFAPDVIMFAGDREDAMVAALIGIYAKIPTVHFFGGDHTVDGNVDNPVRHAISKLSSLHFVIHESHKERLKALGEEDMRIHVVGNPALDRYKKIPYVPKQKILKLLNKEFWKDYVIVIHHPILGFEEKAGAYFEEVLISLKKKKINAFISYPNTDAGNKDVISAIQKYMKDESFYFFKNLERSLFINLMRNALFMIGNSSAGIIESSIIPLGVLNVGERQKGRLVSENVIFVDQGIENISEGIEMVLSENFQAKLKNVKSIYGQGNSVNRIANLLKSLDFSNYRFKIHDPLNGFLLSE